MIHVPSAIVSAPSALEPTGHRVEPRGQQPEQQRDRDRQRALPAKSGEQKRSVVDIRRAADAFKWRPEVSLRDGLAKTVEFFRTKA